MAYKQHFIEWFSGKQIPSYWYLSQVGGSGSTFVGKDEVDGGMVMISGTGANNNSWWGFNAKNQYAHDGFVQIAVWRLDPTSNGHTYNNAQCGMSAQTNDTGANSVGWTIRKTQTYIDFRTKNGSSATDGFINTTTPVDNNFHHTKIQANSASSYDFSVDNVLSANRTTNLPQGAMSPFVKCDDSGQVPSALGIRYMECYNT